MPSRHCSACRKRMCVQCGILNVIIDTSLTSSSSAESKSNDESGLHTIRKGLIKVLKDVMRLEAQQYTIRPPRSTNSMEYQDDHKDVRPPRCPKEKEIRKRSHPTGEKSRNKKRSKGS
ncbi:unnamed protein product [Cyprideis torosa]|uniref:Uncharacterized protein n=1 Tax=Cyprideis torosa TaxID=163714 RepID=A0A7R8WRC0_9CRUS|nr:unnamed protein product [Cyprideis torosa]CAG0907384.1 unnamed protein product [Cyprideis torosa]